ncbi:unnamed protein product, partial [Adineta ricciae]
RLIGWATMRQLRVKSELCVKRDFIDQLCSSDYNFVNEDRNSYQPGWTNVSSTNPISSFIIKAFQYQSNETLDTYFYEGNHGIYGKGGYVYEFRGNLFSLQTNLSQLHQNQWIDNRTRAIILQLTLYNPNVQLFTSITFLTEFLSSSGVYPSVLFQPINFQIFSSTFQLISAISYLLLILYFMFVELRLMFNLQLKYFLRFWSFIEIGIIV